MTEATLLKDLNLNSYTPHQNLSVDEFQSLMETLDMEKLFFTYVSTVVTLSKQVQ